MNPTKEIIQKTKEYLAHPAVVGYEQSFMNFLYSEFADLGLKITRHDTYLVIEGDAPESHIITAHADRHGLVVNDRNELSYAAYRSKERIYNVEPEVKHALWQKIKDRFINEELYAYNADTGEKLMSGTVERDYFCPVRQNYIFISPDLLNLPENTPVSFSPNTTVHDEHIQGQLDNVISMASIYVLYKNGYRGTAILTTHEEIGMSWRCIIDYLNTNNIKTRELFVIDTSPFDESDNINVDAVVLRNKDNQGLFNTELTEKIKDTANNLSITIIVKDEFLESQNAESMGNTELGRVIQNTDARINGTTIQIPTIGYHSNNEKTSHAAIDNFYTLLSTLLIQK